MADANDTTPKFIYFAPAMMLMVGVLPLPYGYYELLRLVTTVSALWIANLYWQAEEKTTAGLFFFIALIFNPVFKIHLTREYWMGINLVAAAVFAAAGVRSRNR